MMLKASIADIRTKGIGSKQYLNINVVQVLRNCAEYLLELLDYVY